MENNALTRLTEDEGELFLNDFGIFVHSGGFAKNIGKDVYPNKFFVLPSQEPSDCANGELVNKILSTAQGEQESGRGKQFTKISQEASYDVYFAPTDIKGGNNPGWAGIHCLIVPTLTEKRINFIKDRNKKCSDWKQQRKLTRKKTSPEEGGEYAKRRYALHNEEGGNVQGPFKEFYKQESSERLQEKYNDIMLTVLKKYNEQVKGDTDSENSDREIQSKSDDNEEDQSKFIAKLLDYVHEKK